MLLHRFSMLLLALACLQAAVFLPSSWLHYRKWKKRRDPALTERPVASVIVPCYNEELTVENCVESLLRQDYGDYEVILVDDGSTDATAALLWSLADRYEKIRMFCKENGGKSTALNYGIERAAGEYVVCVDADSLLLPDALTQLMSAFELEPDADAVAGNVKVINRRGLWGRSQAIEYVYGQMYLRRAFDQLGCVQVISGAIGAFRKRVFREVGGYSSDTLVEDMDLTINMARHRMKVVFNPYAISYTEAPESFRQLMRQRYRWGYGWLQTMIKHFSVIGEWTRMGLIGLPVFALYPWIYVVSSFTWLLVFGWVLHGGLLDFLAMFIVLGIYQMVFSWYAIRIDERESKDLAWIVWVDTVVYARFLSFMVMFVSVAFALRRKVRWGQERLGRNVADPSVSAVSEPVTACEAAFDPEPSAGFVRG